MEDYHEKKTAEVGVIIGRFQVHELHKAHHQLIKEVKKRHKRVIVMIGSTPGVKVSRRNPMDYQTRMLMIQEKFPNIVIIPINDQPSDKSWSETVDRRIGEIYDYETTALLYGSRDGFIPYYQGKHETVELAAKHNISGSKVRKMISDEVRKHSEFRRGCVYAAFNRHKTVYQTVDIAILDKGKVVVGRKVNDPVGIYRFPGGFLDPVKDQTIEGAARREGSEEIKGIEFSDVQFLCSLKVNDWRYRNEEDKIMTCFFTATYMYGKIEAGDDLHEVTWIDLNEDNINYIIDSHKPLYKKLLTKRSKTQ